MKKFMQFFTAICLLIIIQTQTAKAQEWGYCEHNYYYNINICNVQSVWNMQVGSAAWYVETATGNFYWHANLSLNNSGWGTLWISGIMPQEQFNGPVNIYRNGMSNVGTSATWVDVMIQAVNGSGTMTFSW